MRCVTFICPELLAVPRSSGAGVRALGTPAAAGAPPPQSSAKKLAKSHQQYEPVKGRWSHPGFYWSGSKVEPCKHTGPAHVSPARYEYVQSKS